MSVVLFPPPFYFVFYISNLLSYIQNNLSYELARPIMGTIFLVIVQMNNTGVTGQILPPNTDFEHVRV